jgi:hypothetical protein
MRLDTHTDARTKAHARTHAQQRAAWLKRRRSHARECARAHSHVRYSPMSIVVHTHSRTDTRKTNTLARWQPDTRSHSPTGTRAIHSITHARIDMEVCMRLDTHTDAHTKAHACTRAATRSCAYTTNDGRKHSAGLTRTHAYIFSNARAQTGVDGRTLCVCMGVSAFICVCAHTRSRTRRLAKHRSAHAGAVTLASGTAQ